MAATGWWFILWLWAPIYGSCSPRSSSSRCGSTFNDPSGAAWFATHTGIFVITLITIVLAGILVSLGMAGYARMQKWCFYGGLLGFAIMVILLLVNNQSRLRQLVQQRDAQALRDEERLRGDDRRGARKAGTPPAFGFSGRSAQSCCSSR